MAPQRPRRGCTGARIRSAPAPPAGSAPGSGWAARPARSAESDRAVAADRREDAGRWARERGCSWRPVPASANPTRRRAVACGR